jgi:membrane protein YdbS with pleckstrin-like domain
MPILLILILAIIIAQVGFWKTLGSILGAIAMIVLLVLLVVAALGILGAILTRRTRRRF